MPPTPRETLLDGEWQIVFDPENKGRRENWQALPEPPSGARPIRVPSVWEEINPNYDGVAWYWKRVQFPPTPPNGRTTLRFDAVNYFSEVWIDGRFVGGKEGGYTPFEFFVTEFVRGGGEHTLVVRVLCPPKDGELDGFVLKATPCWRQEESFNFGGIWQSVRLFNYPAVNIGDCRVQPTAELNGVDVTGLLLNRIGASEAKIRFALCLWPQPDCPLLERVESFQGLSKLHTIPVYTHLSIENPQLWSPDSPNLYLLKIQSSARLGREWIEDNIQVRFGLRWLTLKNLRFHLNGEPIFLKGGFHEGLYPMGLVIPPSREFVEDEIAKAKRAGFNLLRFWQIPIHPLVLDVADEMGMMLCEEPPIEWILQTEKTYELCEEEIRRMVLRDRNRPSVVMWTVLNEGGSLDKPRPGRVITAIENLPGTVVQRKLERFCQEAIRRFDLTRLIIDESGAWGKPAYAYLPSSNERVVINDIHRYIPGPTSDAALAPLRAFGQETGVFGRGHVVAGRPVFVSEFGYGSFPDLPKLVSQYEEHGGQGREDYEALKTLLGSFEEGFRARRMDRFFSGIGEIIEETQRIHAESDYLQALAIRSNPRATGYVMHAFSAGGCILGAEAFDMWRNEKAVARAIAEANQPHVLAVFLSDTATDGGAPMLAEVFSINEDGPAWGLTLTLTIRDAPGGKSKSKTVLGEADALHGVWRIWSGAVPVPGGIGEYRLEFALEAEGSAWAGGHRRVWVLPALAGAPTEAVGVLEGRGREKALKAMQAIGASVEDDPAQAALIIAALEGDAAELAPRIGELARAGKRVLVFAATAPDMAKMVETMGAQGTVRPCRGNWSPAGHYCEDPSLLAGLPPDRLLGQAYGDVRPELCVRPFQEGALAGCLTYSEGGAAEVPLEVWWGSTIFERPVGAGSAALCAFRLLDGAPARPVARRLLWNLLSRLR